MKIKIKGIASRRSQPDEEPAQNMIRSYGMSHVGQVRNNNEDSFAARPELGLFAVADGMGGAQAGERASRITIETLLEAIGAEATPDQLAEAVTTANEKVRREARDRPEFAGMGTTIVAALVRPPRAHIVNVGDSRAYLRADGDLYCVTTDHSWVNDVGRGLGLSDDQLRSHPYRNVLTKAIGAEDDLEVQRVEIAFTPGDLLLLCSDGLHGVAGERALVEVLEQSTTTLKEKCEELIRFTLDRGAPDNVTAVLIENAGEGE